MRVEHTAACKWPLVFTVFPCRTCTWKYHRELSVLCEDSVHAESVAHSIHQASFKPPGWLTGDPITDGKKKKKVIPNVPRHKSFALMLCGKPLTIQFQTQTPTIYTVPELPPSPGDFTFIRPHTSIKGRVEGVCSSYDVTTPRRNRKKRGWRVQRESGGSE